MAENRPRVIIKAIYPLTTWKYNAKSMECQICNENLTHVCLSCNVRSKQSIETGHDIMTKCPVVIGQCRDAFHVHCAETWYLNQQNCAVCQQPWIVQEAQEVA